MKIAELLDLTLASVDDSMLPMLPKQQQPLDLDGPLVFNLEKRATVQLPAEEDARREARRVVRRARDQAKSRARE